MPISIWSISIALVGISGLMTDVCVIAQNNPPERVVPFEPEGHLFLVGGGRITPEIRREFLRLGQANSPDSVLVIIPTASELADEPQHDWRVNWTDAGFSRIEVLHTRDRAVADSESFGEVLQQATAVWLEGGDQKRLADAYVGTAVERSLRNKIQTGGVVGGTSAGAAIASRVMIAGGREEPRIEVGLDLLPDAILDQHFTQRQRQARLLAAVTVNPCCVGLGIDEATAVIVHQRSLRIVGEGAAHLYLAATKFYPAEQRALQAGIRDLDWTTLVRTQRERQLEPFPTPPVRVEQAPAAVEVDSARNVPHGSLLIVGGGGATDEIWQTFVDRAGGPSARIVILPTAVPQREITSSTAQSFEARQFARRGVKDISVLPEIDFDTVNSAPFCQKLSTATGIWFGGGRQWRFVDAYEDTKAVAAMNQCLQNGGIIGGSSAGATIQGELLIRGAPVGNQIMVQDGYRRGFGFLPGVGIDQHFAQRSRFLDLEQTIRQFPAIVGVGIDEATALLVEKTQGRVLGRGSVYVYDAQRLPLATTDLPPAARPLQFRTGQAFDLRSFELTP